MVDDKHEKIQQEIRQFVGNYSSHKDPLTEELVAQMIENSLKLLNEGYDTGQIKLMNRALKEMRYAYRIFNKFKGSRCMSIFGSARTPETHPDYLAAKMFGAEIASHGWMCITGGANGIMKAGLEGSRKESSFGLSIRLPFESIANTVIEGDPKLITFRYFFTRKLMFVSHSDALAVFPGGVGTLDELFEVLTLIQTGRSNVMPIVLVEGEGGIYWKNWEHYIQTHLLANGWISPEDMRLFYIAQGPQDAVKHVLHFYRRYHSSRYVKDKFVIRMLSPLSEDHLKILNEEFGMLIASGSIQTCLPEPEESDHLELPRLSFYHTRNHFGKLRQLIDRINSFE